MIKEKSETMDVAHGAARGEEGGKEGGRSSKESRESVS